VFKSTIGGGNWTSINTGLTDLKVSVLAIDPMMPQTLYAGTDSGVFELTQVPPSVPIIQSVLLSTNAITNGGEITLTIRAQSNSPVETLNLTLDGPTGNIHNGGSTNFTEVSPEIWETQWVDTISQWASSGVYTYSHISVENEAMLESTVWPPLTFTVKTGTQATVTPAGGGSLVYTNQAGYSTTVDIPPGAVTETTELDYTFIQGAIPPGGFAMVDGYEFLLDAYQAGEYQPDFKFLKPITLTIWYSDADVVGLDEADLKIYWKDGSSWEEVTNTCTPPSDYERDTVANWLKVPICHLTQFAMFSEQRSVYLPVVLSEEINNTITSTPSQIAP
jgi:hypothetical protein